jgi:ubiquinone biosynthesis protein COQ4
MANPADTDRAVHFVYALGMHEFERNFQRFAASEGGRALLAARPSLLDALSDRDSLARLPNGSFGRAYLSYLEDNGFAPDGVLSIQARVQAQWEHEEGIPPLDPLRSWFRDRTLLAHDLFHVLTDYGTDEIGEATLLAFSLAQFGGRGQALLTFAAALEVSRTLGWPWLVYDFCAWRRGRRSAWLVAMPWEELLPLRLDTVRRLTGVTPVRDIHPRGVLRGSPDAHVWGPT